MSTLEGARCVGRWWLFDSMDPADHAEARDICDTCPVLIECDLLLTRERQYVPAGTPTGTWAGRFLGKRGTVRTWRPPPRCGTQSGYDQHRRLGQHSCEPCRHAHAEYEARSYARRTA